MLLGLPIAVFAVCLSSCDSAIYEGLEPCTVQNRLYFVWDYNLLFTDAFKEHVTSVAVYGFDKDTDKFAWVRTEKGDTLAADGYYMDLNGIEPGHYNIVAWCGVDNDHPERDDSFVVAQLKPGESTRKDLLCYLQERTIDEQGIHHSAAELFDLWHGSLEDVEIYDPEQVASEQDHRYTVKLKKNTNNVRVILQQLNGRDIEADKFKYTIEEDNGTLNHDNSLNENDQTIHYHQFRKMAGFAGVLDPNEYPETGTRAADLPEQVSFTPTRTINSVRVAVADLKINRLMANRKAMLSIHTDEDSLVARIPLVDYALLTRNNYSRPMTEQEFLDRQDNYTLTFFLSREYSWIGTCIIINSWRVVINNETLGKK